MQTPANTDLPVPLPPAIITPLNWDQLLPKAKIISINYDL